MKIEITQFPGKPKHMFYITEYKESENNRIVWATYDRKKDAMRFKCVRENPLMKYADVLQEYCIVAADKNKTISIEVRY